MVKLDCKLVSGSGNYWDNLQENTLIGAIFKSTAGKKSANPIQRNLTVKKVKEINVDGISVAVLID